MRDIERDQIRQCTHGRIAKTGEILRDLDLELAEQDREFIIVELGVLFEWIAGVGWHKRGPKALHRIQALFRHFHEVVFATKGMRKVAAIHSNPRATQ